MRKNFRRLLSLALWSLNHRKKETMSKPLERYQRLALKESLRSIHRYPLVCKELSLILRGAYSKLPKNLRALILQDTLTAFRFLPGYVLHVLPDIFFLILVCYWIYNWPHIIFLMILYLGYFYYSNFVFKIESLHPKFG